MKTELSRALNSCMTAKSFGPVRKLLHVDSITFYTLLLKVAQDIILSKDLATTVCWMDRFCRTNDSKRANNYTVLKRTSKNQTGLCKCIC